MKSTQLLTERYLMGIIKNRGVNKRYLVGTTKIENPVHRAVLETLKEMQEGAVAMSPELVVDRLMNNQELKEMIGPEKIYSFVQKALDCDTPGSELHSLHDAIIRNYVFTNGKRVLSDLVDRMDNEEALSEAMDVMRYLKSQSPQSVASVKQQMLEAKEEALNGAKSLIPYRHGVLNRHLGGVSRGEVTIIAGRPGHGKTTFALDCGTGWLDQGLKVLAISKEMKAFRLLHKQIASKSKFTSRQLYRGEIEDSDREEFDRICDELAEQYEGRFWIHDDVYDMHKIESLVAKYQPDVIIDDFIQLTACDDANMRLEILKIMKHYKQIAKEYHCAVVTLSQLNRSIEAREDPVPRLSDLAESGAIEQLAADVLFVYYGHKVRREEPADQVTIVAGKTRYGTTGQCKLGFDGEHMTYREIPVVV